MLNGKNRSESNLPGSLGRKRRAETTVPYRTPPECLKPILYFLPTGRVLEPCAGDGAILNTLQEAHVVNRGGWLRRNCTAVEIRAEERPALGKAAAKVYIADFIQWTKEHHRERYDLIITNPPFSLGVQIAEAALPLLSGRGQLWLLNRLSFMASKKRKPFHQKYPSDVFVHPGRFSFVPSGSVDTWDYAWFRWPQERRSADRVQLPSWRVL